MEKMQWHEQRQKALAQNIANADTPGYHPKDVKPLDFKKLLQDSTSATSLTMAATDGKHMGLHGAAPGQHAVTSQASSYGTSLSGNSVSLEEQLLKMNENFTDHRMTTTIYQKNIDMIKAALRSQ